MHWKKIARESDKKNISYSTPKLKLTFGIDSMVWCDLAASVRTVSTASCASLSAPRRVDKYDNLEFSTSPVAFSRHGINMGKCGAINEPDESIISEIVRILILRISATVCVTPVCSSSGKMEEATARPDLPWSDEAAETQSWCRK